MSFDQSNSYTAAGVDINAGERFADMIRDLVEEAWPNAGEEIGGFAGSGPIPREAKVVKASADGTGTVAILSALAEYFAGIGYNAVAMAVVDTFIAGARVKYVLDVLDVAKLIPEKHINIIKSIIKACKQAGCRLIGGETAELPDMFKEDWMFNLNMTAIGFPDSELRYVPMRPGQLVYMWPSYGPGSNGFSLLRKVHNLKIKYGFWGAVARGFNLEGSIYKVQENLTQKRPELGGLSLANALLVPTPIWIQEIEEQQKRGVIYAGHAHITGGGFSNVERIVPNDPPCRVVIDRHSWKRPTIFGYTQEVGKISLAEMDRVFNNGVMIVSIVDQEGVLPDNPNCTQIGIVEKRRDSCCGQGPKVELIYNYND